MPRSRQNETPTISAFMYSRLVVSVSNAKRLDLLRSAIQRSRSSHWVMVSYLRSTPSSGEGAPGASLPGAVGSWFAPACAPAPARAPAPAAAPAPVVPAVPARAPPAAPAPAPLLAPALAAQDPPAPGAGPVAVSASF